MDGTFINRSLERLQNDVAEGGKSLMEGHVEKMKKGFFSKWEKVYLVLSRTELRIYKGSSVRRSQEHDRDKPFELPKGAKYRTYPLRDMMVKDAPVKMKKHDHVFDIFAENSKRLVIATSSDAIKRQWIAKITEAANDFRGPTDSERKRTQAEVDKELLRLAEHIRGEQAQQRARAIPIHMAQGLTRGVDAPNDLISTEERKASLYRTASAFPVSSFRGKKGPPPPVPAKARQPPPPPPRGVEDDSEMERTPSGSITLAFSGVVSSRRGSFDSDNHSRLSSSYGANSILASGAGASGGAGTGTGSPRSNLPKSPDLRKGLLAGRTGGDQSSQLSRHALSMRSVRELGSLPPPPVPPLPAQPTVPASAPPARPPPRVPPPQLMQRKAMQAQSAPRGPTPPGNVSAPTPAAPTQVKFSPPASQPIPIVPEKEARPNLPPRPKNSVGGRKGSDAPAPEATNHAPPGNSAPTVPPRNVVGSPIPPPRKAVPAVPIASIAPPARARGNSSPAENKNLAERLVSPRIRISASEDDESPVFDRPIGREAAEDTPLTKHEPLSTSPVRTLVTPHPSPLAPLPPQRSERPSPPAQGLHSSRSHGSRIEKACVVHRQPKHFLPAPLPRPNQSDDGEVTGQGAEPGAPPRPARPMRSKTGLT